MNLMIFVLKSLSINYKYKLINYKDILILKCMILLKK